MYISNYENKPFKPPKKINPISSRPSTASSPTPINSVAGNGLKRAHLSNKLAIPTSLKRAKCENTVNNIQIFTMMFRKPSNKVRKVWAGDGFAKYVANSGRLFFYNEQGKPLGSLPIIDDPDTSKVYKAGSWEYQLDYEVSVQSELDDICKLITSSSICLPSLNKTDSSRPLPLNKSDPLEDSSTKKVIPLTQLLTSTIKSNNFNPVMKKSPSLTDQIFRKNTISSMPNVNHEPIPKFLSYFDASKIESPIIMNKLRTTPIDVIIDPLLARFLRPHQIEGVKFMYDAIMGFERIATSHLATSSIVKHDSDLSGGCLLADEMGLGKTLSTITLIWTLIKQTPYPDAVPCSQTGVPLQGLFKKVLIVCPVTLIQNWKNEFKKWLTLNKIGVLTLSANNTASKDKQDVRNFLKVGRTFQILIIGYEKLLNVVDELLIGPHQQKAIDLLVCDEGHRLKNNNSKILNALKSLDISKKILLSGTPIQNDLEEFYTIIDFLNPGILGSYASFKKRYISPITRARDMANSNNVTVIEKGEQRSDELIEITKKFILRRTNDILNKYLPPKTDLILFCKPTSSQLDIFERILMASSLDLSNMTFNSSLGLITLLKKVCNSPSLVSSDPYYSSTLKSKSSNILSMHSSSIDSGKLKVLLALLRKIRTVVPNEKVVIVSNYTQTLDIIQGVLASENMVYVRLDGSTPNKLRDQAVNLFNKSHSVFAFLLSAKSGGVGLNLIGGSRLILFDNDWNPSVDLQAMSRIHRDGQKNSCFIYRLVTTGCIDEKILQRQLMKHSLSKKFLGDSAMGETKASSNDLFSKADLKDLFSVSTNTNCNTHDLICSCDGSGENNNINNDLSGHIDESSKAINSLPLKGKDGWVTALEAHSLLGELEDKILEKKSKSLKNCLVGYKHIDHRKSVDFYDEVMSETLPLIKKELTFAFVHPGNSSNRSP